VVPKSSTEKSTRRRGDALEAAILEAGWSQLTTAGYDGFTFDSVAELAQTSKPVLYRRWHTREELLLAVVHYRGAHEVITIPDTGSLRGDAIEVFTAAMSEARGIPALFSAALGIHYRESGLTPGDLRLAFIGDRSLSTTTILERAIERGEADRDRLTPRVMSVAMDLVRGEALLTMGPVSKETVAEIVDQIFLPLVSPRP
jgi:AcrR family transcriptional regulator